jgi:hypothetical protein
MLIKDLFDGDSWTKQTARNALPILVECAKHGKPLTYSQLDKFIVELGLGHHVIEFMYGYPLGVIGNAIIELSKIMGEPIPPINALVINAKTEIPGHGFDFYLEWYSEPEKETSEMTLDEKKAIIEEIHEDIFSYDNWEKVLEECGLQRLQKKINFTKLIKQSINTEIVREGWSNECETENHKKLKNYVAEHPEIIGLNKNDILQIVKEYQFASGDKADIVFKCKNRLIGVEVKSILSNDADLQRGVFQAVKYQSLLRAEQKLQQDPPNARAVLVTEKKLPTSLQNIADTLGIKIFIFQVNN